MCTKNSESKSPSTASRKLGACVLGVLLIFTSPQANAQFGAGGSGGSSSSQKQDEKKNSRWTLADWLAYKQQTQAMDLWLAKNSQSNPFEFFIEGSSTNYNRHLPSDANSDGTNVDSYAAQLGAYAGRTGLRGGYESNTEKVPAWFASFIFRIFGRAIQDTHINLEYGLRGFGLEATGTTAEETFQNQYLGASLCIYFTKHFGIDGTYRSTVAGPSSLNRKLGGETTQGGVFIDFGALRVFGTWRSDRRDFEALGASPRREERREGYGGGIRLFF